MYCQLGFCLALIYGAFFLHADVATQKRKQAHIKEKRWDWVMTSDAHQAVSLNSKTFGANPFPNNVVCALKELLAFLAGQGIVDPHVTRHKVVH